MRVATVVITYNRKKDLKMNIEAVLKQNCNIEKIFIIDNHSNDGTMEMLEENDYLKMPIIEYIYLSENIGGAGGFYTGTQKAYNDGYDYIILMDDDGRPENENTFKNLIEEANTAYSNNKLIMINSLVVGNDMQTLSFGLTGKIKTKKEAENKSENNIILETINPFNGTLISKELIKKIGFPNKEFFIKGDERDYQLRALKNNAFVATVTNSIYFHPQLERKNIKFFNKNITGSTEAPWKEYYRARNYTYMLKKNNENIKYIRQNIKQILFAIRYNKQKVKTIKMIFKGWHDGKKEKLGKVIVP